MTINKKLLQFTILLIKNDMLGENRRQLQNEVLHWGKGLVFSMDEVELALTMGEKKSESVSRSVMTDSLGLYGLQPIRLLCLWNSPGRNSKVGCHFLLQGIFPTQGSNLCLLHCVWILYHLSHERSPLDREDFIYYDIFRIGEHIEYMVQLQVGLLIWQWEQNSMCSQKRSKSNRWWWFSH